MKGGSKGRGKRLLMIGLTVPVLFAALVLFLQHRESQRVSEQKQHLQQVGPLYQTYDATMLADLPAPVARYFRYALSDGQPFVSSGAMLQKGVLRTSIGSPDWTSFTARQFVVPGVPGFVWNARINVRPASLSCRSCLVSHRLAAAGRRAVDRRG